MFTSPYFIKEARSELSFMSSLLGHMVLTCNDPVLFGFVLGYEMLAVWEAFKTEEHWNWVFGET